jgi:hypothetical protein
MVTSLQELVNAQPSGMVQGKYGARSPGCSV